MDKPNDLVAMLCRQAAKKHTRDRHNLMFNLAGFAQCLAGASGTNEVIDGNICRSILCGRTDVKVLPGGSHYEIVENDV